MTSSPSLDSKPSTGKSSLRRVLIGALILLVAVVVAAEAGLVSAQSSEANWSANSRYAANTETVNRRRILLGRVQFAPTVQVSVGSNSDRAIATEAANAIRKASPTSPRPPEARLEITITEAVTDGASWVPFVKSGSCRFRATYTLKVSADGSSITIRGDINGTVKQSMKGLCSTALFREKLGTGVAAAISGDINRVLQKHN